MIKLEGVSKYIGESAILEDISLSVEKGQMVFLFGPVGAGKSTIIRLVHFDERPTSGRVIVGDYDSATLKKRHIPLVRRKVGVIFQDFKLLKDRNVFENVVFALRVTGTKAKEAKRRAIQSLSLVDLGHKRNSLPGHLSGGEQQKVAIARALALEPFALLADEPTGNLDADAKRDIMDILRKINHKGTAVLVATHDEGLLDQSNGKVVRIKGGRLC